MRRSRRLTFFAVGTSSVLAAALTAATIAAPSAAADSFGAGTPAFEVSAAPGDIDQGLFANADFAGEPSIGVDWTTGAALYQASNSTYKIVFDNAPTPPTITWSDASSPFSQFNIDPILGMNSKTGTAMAGGDDGACGVMSVTHDDGGSWTPTLPCPIAPDHPTVGIGPFHQPAPLDAVGTEAAYFCQQPILNAAPDECSYSHDGGLSWKPSAPDPDGTCQSLFGHVKIAPDGTAYIPDNTCTDAAGNRVVGGLITTDNGQSLSGYTIPGAASPSRGFDPSVAISTDGTLYESWSRASDNHPMIASSSDQGRTWSAPVDISAASGLGLTAATFEAAVAGSPGHVAVAYLGTSSTDSKNSPFDGSFTGTWYLYVSFTSDGGATWQTVQADPEPVQRGGINDGGTTSSDHRNLLDFMDASVTPDGRVVVAYADGCLGACNGPTGTPAQSASDNYATIAYQDAGTGLFS